MSRHTLPRALFTALVAGAAAVQTAAALPPVRVEALGDDALAAITGKYHGANMLVGLRIDVVSSVHASGNTQAQASGSLLVRRTGSGYTVAVDTRAQASGDGEAPASSGVVTGGESLQVAGIGQITQIAGDGNAMANLTTIRFVPNVGDASGFNGHAASAASVEGVSAQISFGEGAMRLDLHAPGAWLGQHVNARAAAAGGGVMQIGQLSGNAIHANNQLHLQIATELMPAVWQQQLGVLQALTGLQGLSR